MYHQSKNIYPANLVANSYLISHLFSLCLVFRFTRSSFKGGRFYTDWVWFCCQITHYRCGHLPPKLWKFNKWKFYTILVQSEKFNCSICPRNLPFVRVFPYINLDLFSPGVSSSAVFWFSKPEDCQLWIVEQYIPEAQLNCILVFPKYLPVMIFWW